MLPKPIKLLWAGKLIMKKKLKAIRKRVAFFMTGSGSGFLYQKAGVLL